MFAGESAFIVFAQCHKISSSFVEEANWLRASDSDVAVLSAFFIFYFFFK